MSRRLLGRFLGRFLPLLLLFFAAITARPAEAGMLGDPRIPFSADRTLVVGERTYTGKVYAIPGSQRHEQLIEGVEQVVILHGDSARGWLILPALNSFVEFGFTKAATELRDQDLLSTKLGEETIDGRKATKYRVEHTARDGTEVDGYIWLTKDGIPMRMEGTFAPANGRKPTPFRMTLSNVATGPQDPSLFDLPQNMVKLPAGALAPLLGMKQGG